MPILTYIIMVFPKLASRPSSAKPLKPQTFPEFVKLRFTVILLGCALTGRLRELTCVALYIRPLGERAYVAPAHCLRGRP